MHYKGIKQPAEACKAKRIIITDKSVFAFVEATSGFVDDDYRCTVNTKKTAR